MASDVSTRCRYAALVRASREDGRSMTAPARRAFLDKFEAEVDPDGILPPPERTRRAEAAKRAYMTNLARKSAKSRSEN